MSSSIRHILFPYDFSAQASQVAPFVRTFAEGFKARITLLSVVPPLFELAPADLGPPIGDDPTEWTRALRTRLEHALLDEFGDLSVACAVEAGDPALRIARFAKEHAVDLIMMPTHGLGLFRTLLVGSTISKVLLDAACPVWTAAHTETQRAGALPRTVLCAIDGSSSTPTLLRSAATFTTDVGAALTLLHVVDPITDWPSLPRERALQESVRQEAKAKVESLRREANIDAPLRLAVGDVVQAVTEEARQEAADLVIVGRGSITEPFGRFRTHLFGIVQHSPCPVLSV
jgi:nucleotide-binding universal stress UspA family protein